MKKVIIIVIVLVIVAIIVLYVMKMRKGKEDGITLVDVKKGEIIEKAMAIGQIVPKQEIIVKSKISGIVKKVYVDVGDIVKPGDNLIDIKPDPTPMEYAEAKRNVELADVDLETSRNDYQRSKELYEKGIMSPQEYDTKLKDFRETQLKLKIAEEKLALIDKGRTKIAERDIDSMIKSQIYGTVLERKVNEGDPIVPLTSYQAGTELLSMADMDNLLFKGTVDEIDVGKIKEGMKVNIKIGAIPDKSVLATLLKISPKARKQENATLFDVEIKIDDIAAVTIRAGYSANAEIIIRKKENVLIIPERLLEFKDGKASVEVHEGPEKITRKEVKTGLSDGIMIEIESGLKQGDKLVERLPREII
jgi:HlyD family secretion protein